MEIFTDLARAEIEAILDLWPGAAETLLAAAQENRVISWSYYIWPENQAKPCGCILGLAGSVAEYLRDLPDMYGKMREEIADHLNIDLEDRRRNFLRCERDLDFPGFEKPIVANEELVTIIQDWQHDRAERQHIERASR